jgi:hypothetical protein
MLAQDLAGLGREHDLLLVLTATPADENLVSVDPGRGGGVQAAAPVSLAVGTPKPVDPAVDRCRINRITGDHWRRKELATHRARPDERAVLHLVGG